MTMIARALEWINDARSFHLGTHNPDIRVHLVDRPATPQDWADAGAPPVPQPSSGTASTIAALPPSPTYVPIQPALEALAAKIIANRQPNPGATPVGTFLTIFQYALALLPSIVTGIQTIAGDATSDADKKKMATDALAAALQGASSVTTGTNAALAQLAAGSAMAIINATDAITTAFNHTKATGAYQAATKTAATNQAAITAASVPAPTPAA